MRNVIYFAVKDLALQVFLSPQPQGNVPAAVRSFTDAINDPQSVFSRHPEDYELYRLCPFDEETGRFLPVSDMEINAASEPLWEDAFRPVLVVRGKDVVKARE